MSADASTTPQVPTPAAVAAPRLAVEHLSGITVVGWAFDPAEPGRERLQLLCGSEVFEPAVRRVQRADVSRALNLAPDLAPGFEFDLPLGAWAALAERDAEFGVRLGGSGPLARPAWKPDVANLRRWMSAVAQGPDPVQAQAALAALRPHLEEARRHAVDAGVVDDAGPLLCHVEGWRGLTLTGWLADSPERPVVLQLRCDAGCHEVPLKRVSRRDVSDQLGLPDEEVGFELEVPGVLWRGAGEAAFLTLQVEARGVPVGPAWTLARKDLPTRLNEALALSDPLQRSYQALLAMEHLAWAGGLGQIDETARQPLITLAESAGVSAWLHGDPAELATPAQVPMRKPFRIAARGRLGRWLERPANAERALAWLERLRRFPALQRLADRWEIMLTLAAGLFDKQCYDEHVTPAERGGAPALRHYVEQGDARSLVPMALFDARHYTGQLPGRRHPGVNRLLHYALIGRRQGLSPCAWFDPTYYLAQNADVRAKGIDPLVHFVNWGWQEGRRPAARFQPTTGTRQGLLQRLAVGRAPAGEGQAADPLKRYLLDGLPAEARPLEPDLLPWAVPARLDGRDYLDLGAWRELPQPAPQPQVDVIVPVYAGAQETLRCLWSVLRSTGATPFELVVIDDCSPEPALSAHLRELASLGLIRLLVNERNLGFVGTVNKGLDLHSDRDVVILNSDTRVHPGWLDRLVAHAQAEPRAASITPLSNNATICSYPRMLHSNWERLELDDAGLDALAAEANRGRHVEVPTGVGFCMWMRRSAMQAIGKLDVERFGRGYGEENDWCLRASANGWIHLVAADVYVLHQGSVSFAGEAGERTRAGLAVLRERHPDYQRRIEAWIADDPLAHARARLDAARLRRAAEVLPGNGLVLMVNHARGGGTARHEAETAEKLKAERGLAEVAMRPSRRAGRVALGTLAGTLDLPALQALSLTASGDGHAVSPQLLDLLRLLDVREVHLHHLVDHPRALRDRLAELCAALGVPLQVTLHDYHFICPRINLVDTSGRYCGEPDRDTCNRCLQRDEAGRAAGRIAPWRAAHAELLRHAARVIVPDRDVAARLSNYFPAVRVQVEPHEPLHLPAVRPPRGPLRQVLVIGALSQVKGFDVLLGMAKSHAAAHAGLRFTLLGYSPDDRALVDAGVQVLGRYEDAKLPALIAEIAPDLILLPSVWPETFCYVLTPAGESGRPVAVFDLGAQARRLKEAGADAIYLPIELAGQPEVLVKLITASFSSDASSRRG
jgi:GT2 family glycosyltransferase/glycosyltransferase involved in cell wall biosynthesis